MKFKYILPVCLLAVTGFVSINAVKMQDDPDKDQIPLEYLEHVQSHDPQPFSVVIDEEGYENFNIGVDFAEPHISMNPQNPTQFFAAYNTNATHYTLNGVDWAINDPSFGQPMRGDPVTAFDSLGRLYYENMYGSPNILGTMIVTSDDNSVTWNPAVFGNVGNDKNWIAADQSAGPYSNYTYTVMTPGNVARSTNRGLSYQVVAGMTNTLPGMMPAVGPNMIGGNVPGGCVYVVTNTGSSFSATYTFYRSTNGGNSFDFMSAQGFANYVGTNVAGRNSVHNMRTRPYPFIAADNSQGPFRGRLYLVYASNNPPGDGNKPDIYCRFSNDHGASWSAPVTVNDDPNSQLHNQWHPAIWCDKETGRLYVHWMDTRDTPAGDSAMIYATYSDNGGAGFVPNQRISTAKMKIDCASCGGGGTPKYLGDYNAVVSNRITSMLVWTDFRNNNFGSYVAYFPDFAMKTSNSFVNVVNNGSATVGVSVPSVKLYTNSVRFNAYFETLPAAGTLNVSFVSGKDSITTYPDSVHVKIDAIGSVTPGNYVLRVEGRGPNGTPVHRRSIEVLVNASYLTVGTNRPGQAEFVVNGTTYNNQQTLVFPNGTNVTVQAISPRTVGGTQYVFTHWSNGGDTTQVINITTNTTLTAFYKIRYRLFVNSTVGNVFGDGFHDSGSVATFGALSRQVVSGGQTYYFRGWTGTGVGSYTSPDSSGVDSVVSIPFNNTIIETARWSTTVGIDPISSELPEEYALYQNFPNPFNPSTKIKFDIIKTGNVKLTIFDVLGKEVAVLLNDIQQPGKYQVEFSAHEFPSGMYFYRIETGDFVQTRKMLMIK
jgi:hypothetical protein